MKKTIKIANIVLVIAMVMLMLSNTVMATTTPTTGESGSVGGVIDKLKPTYSAEGDQGLTSIGQQIINWISIIAIVIAVIVLLILGIKYMIGSASEKAEYKKTMIPYLVGAILIFGAGAIAQVIVNIASSLSAAAGQG